KQGQILKIPISEIKKEEPVSTAPKTERYLTHLVKQGETLYSLSKQYNVSIDSIQIVNDGLKDGLKEGGTIRIPILKKKTSGNLLTTNTLITGPAQFIDTLVTHLVPADSVQKKSLYKIALLLPF